MKFKMDVVFGIEIYIDTDNEHYKEAYGNVSVEDAIEIDKKSAEEDPFGFVGLFSDDCDVFVIVEKVEKVEK